MRPRSQPPSVTTLILLTAFSTLSLNMFMPSLANIASTFQASYATVSLSIGGYLMVTALVQLLAGPISDRVGRRPVLLWAITLFCFASIGCVLAQNVWVFLGFRMLQGGMITGYALSLAIVRDTRPEREAAALIGYISMAMSIAPMLGPILGGFLDTWFGWRSTFVFYTASGGMLWVLCWRDLGETRPPQPRTTGAQGGLGALLQSPLFWALALCNTFATGAFYIFLTATPLVAQGEFGVGPAQLGVFIGSITAGFAFGSFLSGRLAARHAPVRMMMAGRMVACLGLASGLLAQALVGPGLWLFFASTLCIGLGNGITMPSSNAAALSVRPDLAGTAAGLNGALVVAGGAVLTTLTGAALPADAAAQMALFMMFCASFLALICVVAAHVMQQGAPGSASR